MALALAIPELLGRTVDTLSGGELQRVALAAALVTRPALVLLDEPTSQLDPVAGDELIWLLRRLNEEWGVTIVLAEHRLERCLAAADRVVAMDAGTIAFDGAPRDFLAWAQDADPALETPAARLFSLAGHHPAARPASATPAAASPESIVGAEHAPLTQLFRGKREALSDAPAEKYKPFSASSRLRDLWVELGDRDARRDVLQGRGPEGRAWRAGRADGAQRGRARARCCGRSPGWRSRSGGGSRRRRASPC